MGSISANQARAQFTSDLVSVFTDRISPTAFLRSFFRNKQSYTRYVSIQVRRNRELVAVDVTRGSEGNRNKIDRSTEKVFDPAYYREYFDMTELDLYDRLFGSTAIDAGIYAQLLNSAAERLGILRDKIERSHELQCSQVLQTGIVTLVNGDSIDFKRKAASLVDKGSGNYWTTSGIDIFKDFENACVFLRTIGKAPGSVFNATMGQSAMDAMFTNDVFKARVQQNLNNNIDRLTPAQRNSVGATYHGTLSCGTYNVNIWAYPQFYDLDNGNDTVTSTPYVDPKNVIVTPDVQSFDLSFAAVPQVLRTGVSGLAEDMELGAPQAAPFVVSDYVDQRASAHILDIKSACIAIPTAVDQIYTLRATAS